MERTSTPAEPHRMSPEPWRRLRVLEDIERGLVDLVEQIQRRRIGSVAIPPLGSGLGGLDWRQVRARIEAALHDLREVRVEVYEPNGADDSRKARRTPLASFASATTTILDTHCASIGRHAATHLVATTFAFSQRPTRANAHAQIITSDRSRSEALATAKNFALVAELWKLG
jgi:hypothetical protein